MDFASLFSSIILSKPSALADPFMPKLVLFLELTEDDDEWLDSSKSLDPSRLGVGVDFPCAWFLGSTCSAGYFSVPGATLLGELFSVTNDVSNSSIGHDEVCKKLLDLHTHLN